MVESAPELGAEWPGGTAPKSDVGRRPVTSLLGGNPEGRGSGRNAS